MSRGCVRGRPGFAITERLRVLVCAGCKEVIDWVSDILGQRRLSILASRDDRRLLDIKDDGNARWIQYIEERLYISTTQADSIEAFPARINVSISGH